MTFYLFRNLVCSSSLFYQNFQNKFNFANAKKAAAKRPNDDAALIAVYAAAKLQFAVEQHVYVTPVPLAVVVVVGHVDDAAHEYVLPTNEPRRYDEAVY